MERTDIPQRRGGASTRAWQSGSAPLFHADETLFVIDLETTGLHPERGDKILEIAVVPVEDGRIAMERAFDRLVNPNAPIPPEAIAVHGITDDMVKDAPPIERVLPELRELLGDLPIVAHNAPFDIGFLRHQARLLGIGAFPDRVIDTIEMSKALFPGGVSHSLDALARRLGVPTAGGARHRSLEDARITAECYLAMKEMARRLR